MRISELKDGQVVRYRHGKWVNGRIVWDAWQTGRIGVSTREKAYRKLKAGVVAIDAGLFPVCPQHDYNPPHDCRDVGGENYPNGYFMAEDCCLEIADIEPGWEFAMPSSANSSIS